MNKLAVVGLGSISTRHRANLKILYPNSTIVAMSASGRLLQELPSNSDAIARSIDEIIDYNPDMVIIASPATLHNKHAIPFIESGIPVLIEKPISASLVDAKAVLQALQNFKTPVAIGYCLRYLSSSQEINSVLQSGLIGELYNVSVEVGQYLPDWRTNQNYKNGVSASRSLGGGALLELSHEIDYTQWLVGQLSPISAILRSSKDLDLEVEDSADILSINKEGTVISMHLDFLQRKPYRKCRFIGSKGSLEWNLIKNSIVLHDKNQNKIIFNNPEWDRNKMYLNMILDFESMILGKSNQCITPLEATDTVSFISKVRSLNKNWK